ncbi:hypothetical protein ACWDXH_14240 [Micromonospora chokoriensis]
MGAGHAPGAPQVIERELPRSVWVPMVARQTIAEHQSGSECRRCRPDGCTELRWARDRLKAYRVAGNRSQRY